MSLHKKFMHLVVLLVPAFVHFIPSLDLIAVWNDSAIDDHDKSPGNPDTKNNRALKTLVEACETK